MVNKLMKAQQLIAYTFALTLLLFTLPSISMADTTLNASVDRNKIYEADTLNLIITGDIEMDFSFGGLMNFGRNQIEAPVMEGLEQDFEILDQKQSYNMQSINGDTKAKVTWTYSLAPRHTGKLTIPAAKFKDSTSNSIEITVTKGKAPQDASNPPQVFIEAVVDKTSAYVQEQVIYTLRLYSADRLASGDLSVPESNDAIIEALGDTKKYFRMAYNRRYEVRERQYLLFPQKSGELIIEPQTFNGLLIDTRNRRRVRVREMTEALTISIKPPPASFSGDVWLPATSLHLSEVWSKSPEEMMVGDSITRTLEIKALGLLGSALPPIGIEDISGLKIYPESPKIESQQHESGAQSFRQEATALVAISPKDITLPEIRIAWWDTVNDVERLALIPAHHLNIKVDPETQLYQALTPPPITQEISQAATQEALDDEQIGAPLYAGQQQPKSNHLWYTIIVLLLIGWASTAWFLFKRSTPIKVNNTDFNPDIELSKLYKMLCQAIKNDEIDMPKLLVQWADKLANSLNLNLNIQSLQDLKNIDEGLYQQASAFEQSRYAPLNSTVHSVYDKTTLQQLIKNLCKQQDTETVKLALRPMYP